MHISIKFSLITLTAIVVSMIVAPSAVVMVHAQGLIVPKVTPVAMNMSASMSGMNMSAMPPMTGQTIVRDSVTLLLEGKTIPAKGFLHVYDSSPLYDT